MGGIPVTTRHARSHNKAWRRAHPSRLRREYYAKEDGPPDEVCLSLTVANPSWAALEVWGGLDTSGWLVVWNYFYFSIYWE